MGTPITWRDSSLDPAHWKELNLWWVTVQTASERSPSTASRHRALAVWPVV
jgi:hypothetical protein